MRSSRWRDGCAGRAGTRKGPAATATHACCAHSSMGVGDARRLSRGVAQTTHHPPHARHDAHHHRGGVHTHRGPRELAVQARTAGGCSTAAFASASASSPAVSLGNFAHGCLRQRGAASPGIGFGIGGSSSSFSPSTNTPLCLGLDRGVGALRTRKRRGICGRGGVLPKHRHSESSSSGSFEEIQDIQDLLHERKQYGFKPREHQELSFTHDNDYNSIGPNQNDAGEGYGAKQASVLSGSLVYEALALDANGKTSKVYLKRRDLLRCYDLQPRDLRRVDPSKSDAGSPSLSVRDEAILISLGGMRGIISAEKAIIFEPDSPYAKKFIDIVSPRLAASSGAANFEDTSHQRETRPKSRKVDDKNLPFELECVEGALMVLVGQLDYDLAAVKERIALLLKKLPAQVNTQNLEELRRGKSLLVALESRSEQVQELLAEFLDDEDDIAEMNLTSQLKEEENKRKRKQQREQDSLEIGDGIGETEFVSVSVDEDQIESILEEANRELEEVEDLIEYYFQRCAGTHSDAERLLQGMRDMEESISVVLSSRRFEVNRLELALSMGSFAASLGAMISGIFGMNLRSKLELSVSAFYLTTAGILVLCFSVFWFCFRYTKKRGVL